MEQQQHTPLIESAPGLNKRVYTFKHKPKKFLGLNVLKSSDVTVGEQVAAKPTIRQAFLDVHMGLRHFGLADIARKGGIDVTQLKKREFVLFINPERTTVALFGYGGTLTYISRRYSRSLGVSLLTEDILNEIGELYTSDWGCDPKLKSFLRAYLPQHKAQKTVTESPTN